jgi:HlyD family secretion protein
MSAFANSSAAAQPAPEAPPPKPLAPRTPGRRSRRWWLIAAVVLAIVLAAGAAAWALRPNPEAKQATAVATVRTVKVAAGSIQRTLRVAGTTSARNFVNIVAPMMRGPDAGRGLILIFLAPSGSQVKKGELVAQIDAQAAKDHVEDVDSQVAQAEADIRKRQAELDIEMEGLQQNLRIARANLDKARLDAQATEIRTPIDQELLKLAEQEAAAQYQQIQKDIGTTRDRMKAEIRILELTRDRQVRHRDRHQADVIHFTINSPMDGLVVMQSIWRGGDMGQIQQGDQISPGQPFAKIVDISSMQIEATVNQVEGELIRIGQRATLAFDAFPGLTMKSKVTAIGALAVGGWRQNYYIRNIPVRLSIEGRDPRVIPDLSASADVVLSEQDGTVVVPREAVQEANGKPVVFVRQAGSFALRQVELGEATNTQTAVISGLQPGDEVALQPPATVNR